MTSADHLIGGEAATELASNRTSLSLERTRMSADRTLMSVVRTALSLIGFGFTIFQAFHQLKKLNPAAIADESARNFGLALVLLGELMLAMGIISHAIFGRGLNSRRARIYGAGLLRHDVHYRATPTFIVAVLLLLIGLAAAAGIMFRLKYFR